MRWAVSLCALCMFAALAICGTAAALRDAGGACGKVSAGGAKWTVTVIGDGSCAFAVKTLKTFVKEPHKANGLFGRWTGGPHGYTCSVEFGFNKAVSEGDCSKPGVSYSWTKVGA